MDRWYALIGRVLEDVRARGPPDAADVSLMAHLLRIVDPATCAPLTDAQLLPEIGIVFVAGMETSGKTMGWTLCVPCAQCPSVNVWDIASSTSTHLNLKSILNLCVREAVHDNWLPAARTACTLFSELLTP